MKEMMKNYIFADVILIHIPGKSIESYTLIFKLIP